jgi:drug/metabolite transporter (DMT)-like permease
MRPIAIPKSARFALPALLIGNVALAIGPWLVRLAKTEGQVGPIGSAFWRLALALPIFLIMARGESGPPPESRRKLIVAALVSGLFFAADLGAWHIGILHTRLANATLLGNATAFLFPIYGFIVAGTSPSRKQSLALTLALAGAILLIGRSYELSAHNLVGDFFCLFAGICYTGYLVAADRARAALGPMTMLGWSVAAGLPFLLGIALVMGDPIWPHVWWPLILMTLCSQIVGQGLVIYAVRSVSALVVGLMMLLQPIVAGAIGWLVYGERLTAFDFIGATAVGIAVLLVRETQHALPATEIGLSS